MSYKVTKGWVAQASRLHIAASRSDSKKVSGETPATATETVALP